MSGVEKRSITLGGHRTSVSLEAEFWQALRAIARQRGCSLRELVSEIDRRRSGNLSSAIRLFVLSHYRSLGEPPSA